MPAAGPLTGRLTARKLHLALVVPVDSFDSSPQIIVAVHDQHAAGARGDVIDDIVRQRMAGGQLGHHVAPSVRPACVK